MKDFFNHPSFKWIDFSNDYQLSASQQDANRQVDAKGHEEK